MSKFNVIEDQVVQYPNDFEVVTSSQGGDIKTITAEFGTISAPGTAINKTLLEDMQKNSIYSVDGTRTVETVNEIYDITITNLTDALIFDELKISLTVDVDNTQSSNVYIRLETTLYPIYFANSVIDSGQLLANETYLLEYDGTRFNLLRANEFNKLNISNEIRFEGNTGEKALIQKNASAGRDELQIYAGGDAFGTGSRGAGIHLYGTSDSEHDANCAIMTGADDSGDARMIISERGHTTISSDPIFDYVDDGDDEGTLNIVRTTSGGPAIFMDGYASSEGELAVETGGNLTLGHWDKTGKIFTGRVEMDPGGDWVSVVDGASNLGDADNRWNTVYATTGTINTSDEREKTELLEIEEIERVVALELKQNLRKFKFKSAIEKKGEEAARIHFGIGAQTLGSIFEKHGLDPHEYAIFCYDEFEGGNRYGVRYEELLAFIIAAL